MDNSSTVTIFEKMTETVFQDPNRKGFLREHIEALREKVFANMSGKEFTAIRLALSQLRIARFLQDTQAQIGGSENEKVQNGIKDFVDQMRRFAFAKDPQQRLAKTYRALLQSIDEMELLKQRVKQLTPKKENLSMSWLQKYKEFKILIVIRGHSSIEFNSADDDGNLCAIPDNIAVMTWTTPLAPTSKEDLPVRPTEHDGHFEKEFSNCASYAIGQWYPDLELRSQNDNEVFIKMKNKKLKKLDTTNREFNFPEAFRLSEVIECLNQDPKFSGRRACIMLQVCTNLLDKHKKKITKLADPRLSLLLSANLKDDEPDQKEQSEAEAKFDELGTAQQKKPTGNPAVLTLEEHFENLRAFICNCYENYNHPELKVHMVLNQFFKMNQGFGLLEVNHNHQEFPEQTKLRDLIIKKGENPPIWLVKIDMEVLAKDVQAR